MTIFPIIRKIDEDKWYKINKFDKEDNVDLFLLEIKKKYKLSYNKFAIGYDYIQNYDRYNNFNNRDEQ